MESSGGGGGVEGAAGAGTVVRPHAAARVIEISVIIIRTVMSDTTTRGIRVEVESEYVEERSDPRASYYFFAYHIRVSNLGDETVQLMSRHWIITDGDGNVEEVRGPGVVGEMPILAPGQAFEYTSFCPLRTEVGMMQGTYTMRTHSGETFEAEIAAFTLAAPGVVN